MKRAERAWAILLAWSVRFLLVAILIESIVRLTRATVPSPTGALFGVLLLLAVGLYFGVHVFRFTPGWESAAEGAQKSTQPGPTDPAADLAAIIESSEDAIVSLSPEGRILTWNPAAARVFGYPAAEIVGKSIFLLVPFGKGEEMQNALRRALKPNSQPPYETMLLKKDSTAVEVSISLSPIAGFEGYPARVSFIGRELSDRRRAERLIHQLSRVVEQTADLVMITDAQGVVEYVNPAFEGATGYSKAEVIGGKPNILKSGAHDPDFYADLWKRILSGQPYQGEITNRRKDGSLFQTEKTISPIRDEMGRITHFVSTDKDITARHLLRAAAGLIPGESPSARKNTSGGASASRR